MGLRDKQSALGYPIGARPNDFDLGLSSTLHNVSSTRGRPPFSSYKSLFLKAQRPVNPMFLFPENPAKYLDNPPR